MNNNNLTLYSFRRCPYAIRARMALAFAQIPYQTIEVDLKNKPQSLIELSPKATVPVLLIENNNSSANPKKIIDQSIQICIYALSQNDPHNLYQYTLPQQQKFQTLLKHNDENFKPKLDAYKYHSNQTQKTPAQLFAQCLDFLKTLEKNLTQTKFLITNHLTLIDIAIFPFIRQFANCNLNQFNNNKYKKLQNWLNHFLKDPIFKQIMKK